MYVTSYVICRVSFRCMPNWQLVLGISPQHWDCRDRQTTARRLEGQTEYLINSTIIMTFILLIYQSFLLLLNIHFYDTMLLFLLHHYYVTLPTPQPLEIKEVTNHRLCIFIVISGWSKLALLVSDVPWSLSCPKSVESSSYLKWHRGDSLNTPVALFLQSQNRLF